MTKTAFPPQAYLTASEAANRWLPTPSLDRVPRAKYILSTPEREAAPDLLEALEAARDHIAYSAPGWHYRTRDMVAQIDAAIAKARGGAE